MVSVCCLIFFYISNFKSVRVNCIFAALAIDDEVLVVTLKSLIGTVVWWDSVGRRVFALVNTKRANCRSGVILVA